ncbi:MAG: hypothetical protein K6U89_01285 [Chloroflexi bacterium]|nr:hypothetical protein [Chloroflexota bacterium]
MSDEPARLLLLQARLWPTAAAASRRLQTLLASVQADLVVLPAACLGERPLAPAAGLRRLDPLARAPGALLAGSFTTPEGELPFLLAGDGSVLQAGAAEQPALTPLGAVAVLTEQQLALPEAVRALALAGAELLLVPVRTSRSRRLGEAMRAAACARAFENCLAMALVDAGGYAPISPQPHDGSSGVTAWIAPSGRVLDATDGPGEASLAVSFDLAALRRQRRSPANPLLQLRPPLYAPSYHRLRMPELPLEEAPPPVTLCCLQADIAVIETVAQKDAVVDRNLARTADLVAEAVVGGARVVVFPEFWLQGFVWGRSVAEWQAVCFQVPGPETAALGAIARRWGVYLAGAVFEVDPAWPGRWFTTALLVSPAGEVVLRARKLHSSNILGQLPDSSPGDILAAYGTADLFPVAPTPYGRLAVTASSDLSWPEVARGFRLAGAEILLQAAGSPHTPQATVADLLRQTRARENGMVIASANYGRLLGGRHPEAMSRGYSQVVDWTGEVLGRIEGQGEAYLRATIDLGPLRQARARQPLAALARYASFWDDRTLCPVNRWLERPLTDLAEARAVLPEVIAALNAAGVLR